MTIHGVFFDPGVSFNQETFYEMTGNFTGITDTPTGTMSFWFRGMNPITDVLADPFFTVLLGFNSVTNVSFEASVNNFNSPSIILNDFSISSNEGTFTITGAETPLGGFDHDVGILDSAYVWVQDNKWHHVLASWDFNHAVGSRIYKLTIDRWAIPYCHRNTDDRGSAFSSTFSAYNRWIMGASSGDIADLWFAPGQFLDVSDLTVINKFVDVGGHPADLGTDGSTPTGTAPILYLSSRTGTPTDWLTNRGTGAGTWALVHGAAVAASDTDPVIQNPFRVMTGTTETVQLRTAAVTNDFDTTQVTFIPNLLGSAVVMAPTIFQWDTDTGLFPTEGSLVTLHDDGVSYTTATITPAVDGSLFLPLPCGIGADTAYFPVEDFTGPAQDFALMSLSTGAVTGPFTISPPAWMTTEFGNRGFSIAPMIWWDGREQCVGLMDSAAFSGQACMVDASGTVTTASVWSGFNYWDSNQNLNRDGLYLMCSPDSITGHNRFLTSLSTDGWQGNTATHVVADNTGAELSRVLLRADDPIVDSMINGFSYPFGPFFEFQSPQVANAQGFHYAGNNALLWNGVQVAPDGSSYTKYTFEPDPTDRTAMVILNSSGQATFVDDGTRKWLQIGVGSFSQILFGTDGTPLQDLTTPIDGGSTFNMFPLTQIDNTGLGLQLFDAFVMDGAGTASFASANDPVDPDYSVIFDVTARTVFGFGGPQMPLDGQSMFVILRANGSNNGYKVAITTAGGQYHFQFQIMPSGSVTDFAIGTDGSYGVTASANGSGITVQVVNFLGGPDLAPDGTWTGGNVIDIVDTTYTAAGRIIFGGVGV